MANMKFNKQSKNKPSTKKYRSNKQSSNKQSVNKQSTNKQGSNKQSTNKQSTNKQSTNPQSVKKESSSNNTQVVKKPAELELLYMSTSEITAKDVADFLKAESNIIVDLWEAMNIFEIELPNKATVDFEPVEMNFKNTSDTAFVKNREIKAIFSFYIEEEEFEQLKPYMEKLISKFGGFVCSDSEDFQPFYING